MHLTVGFAVTAILGAIYTAAALFSSLTEVAVGLIVTAVGVIGWHYQVWSRGQRIADTRAAVWARRDEQ